MNNDTIRMINMRMEMMTNELRRLQIALDSVQKGEEFDVAIEEEYLLEAKQEEKKAISYAVLIMEHVLKLKYCTNDRNTEIWTHEVDLYQSKLSLILQWGWKHEEKNIIRNMMTDFSDIYDHAVSEYKRDAKKYEDLRKGIKFIPEKCPWKLVDLIDKSAKLLVKMLPDMI